MDSNMSQPLPSLESLISAVDLTEMLQDWTDLSPSRRGNLASTLNATSRIRAAPSANIRMECGWLNQHLFARRPEAFGMTTGRFSDIVSDLRYMLCRLGRMDTYERGKTGLSAGWIRLWGMIPERKDRGALSVLIPRYAAPGFRFDIAP